MSGLPREVLKWIQSLDLTWQLKTPKWDLTNGYLTAEIFSWYYPQEVEMHMYNNGTSLDSKLRNWSLLKNFFKRHKFEIPEEYVEGTIHCKEGAARLLVERIYEILTNRKVRKTTTDSEVDFTDKAYQLRLPMHARSTASKSVKNNLRITELMADKNIILSQHKAQNIINRHVDYRQMQRQEDPQRFDCKPTIGELSMRRPPKTVTVGEEIDRQAYAEQLKDQAKRKTQSQTPEESSRESDVHFKEVSVNQMGRTSDL